MYCMGKKKQNKTKTHKTYTEKKEKKKTNVPKQMTVYFVLCKVLIKMKKKKK